MIGQLNVEGLYLPWLMVLAAIAMVALWGVRQVLGALGVYRWVWHPALFDVALYVLLLFGLSQASLHLP